MSALPWSAADVDPDEVLAVLHEEFPNVMTWHGEFTGSWWALLRGRLVEARDACQLAESIRASLPSARPADLPVRRADPSARSAGVLVHDSVVTGCLAECPARVSVLHLSWRRRMRNWLRWFFLGSETWG
ncbi:hypothetical protein [Actinomadura rupiterrae]|uniref:hypothetical protein n=1 Tax=Actinomadura rupiterrae TaxID=559627 RepID=UPI0020A40CE8|nr:hypothetical protein [Actinomadura rupiterrae]MCP2336713.1 hypothetical protein [Actinomadura rupiterrae]